ncbi:hypothetical protein Hanom_Chr11g00969681 [Helianthus anomalus]
MELTSWIKIARFQTFWIQMWKSKHLDDIRKSSQTKRTKMAFYSNKHNKKNEINNNNKKAIETTTILP